MDRTRSYQSYKLITTAVLLAIIGMIFGAVFMFVVLAPIFGIRGAILFSKAQRKQHAEDNQVLVDYFYANTFLFGTVACLVILFFMKLSIEKQIGDVGAQIDFALSPYILTFYMLLIATFLSYLGTFTRVRARRKNVARRK